MQRRTGSWCPHYYILHISLKLNNLRLTNSQYDQLFVLLVTKRQYSVGLFVRKKYAFYYIA